MSIFLVVLFAGSVHPNHQQPGPFEVGYHPNIQAPAAEVGAAITAAWCPPYHVCPACPLESYTELCAQNHHFSIQKIPKASPFFIRTISTRHPWPTPNALPRRAASSLHRRALLAGTWALMFWSSCHPIPSRKLIMADPSDPSQLHHPVSTFHGILPRAQPDGEIPGSTPAWNRGTNLWKSVGIWESHLQTPA